MKHQPHKFSIAPMMDWTDRYCRGFHRTLTQHALLYTEMVTADAILNGDRERLIGFDACEHPVALQLGGSDPDKLAQSARIGAEFGYDEINLNVGCPSERVQSGSFGACLMREPNLVADCMSAMREAVDLPVTIKHRLGVDDDEPRDRLFPFVEAIAATGVTTFIVHARKALLSGLSPKQNRDVPPLDYDIVAELKRSRPDLTIILNGGISSMDIARAELPRFDGVMLGRAAYQNPGLLLDVDELVFGEKSTHRTEVDAVRDYRSTIVRHLDEGIHLHAMTRHMLGMFAGQPGARRWRRTLSESGPGASGPGAIEVLDEALAAVSAVPEPIA